MKEKTKDRLLVFFCFAAIFWSLLSHNFTDNLAVQSLGGLVFIGIAIGIAMGIDWQKRDEEWRKSIVEKETKE